MIGRLSVWRDYSRLNVVSNADATTRVRMAVQPRLLMMLPLVEDLCESASELETCGNRPYHADTFTSIAFDLGSRSALIETPAFERLQSEFVEPLEPLPTGR